MSRQRLRPSLGESSRITCPRCLGQGTIRGIESLGLSVIRIIEEEALKENTAQVRAILPNEIAAYLLNEKRQAIIDIEKRQNVTVIVVPSPHLLTPQYEVERIRLSDITEKDEKLASYKLAIKAEIPGQTIAQAPQKVLQEPAVKSMSPDEVTTTTASASTTYTQVHQVSQAPSEPGILKRFFKALFGKKAQPVATPAPRDRYQQQNRTRNAAPRRKDGRNQRPRGGRNRDRGRGGQSGNYRPYENRDNRPREMRGPRDQHQQRDTHASDVQHAAPQPLREQHEPTHAHTTSQFSPPVPSNLVQMPEQIRPVNQLAPRHETVSSEPSDLQPSTAALPNQQPTEGGQQERRQRSRFHHHRHRYNRQRSPRPNQGEQKSQGLEGEDIYTNTKNKSDDES